MSQAKPTAKSATATAKPAAAKKPAVAKKAATVVKPVESSPDSTPEVDSELDQTGVPDGFLRVYVAANRSYYSRGVRHMPGEVLDLDQTEAERQIKAGVVSLDLTVDGVDVQALLAKPGGRASLSRAIRQANQDLEG